MLMLYLVLNHSIRITPAVPSNDRANFIVVVPGANHHLDPEDVSDAGARLKGCKVMVVSKSTS